MSARSASTTELRPATTSVLGLPRRPLLAGRAEDTRDGAESGRLPVVEPGRAAYRAS
jgi:hypothetical protein